LLQVGYREMIKSKKYNEELSLVYQPIVQDASNGNYKIIGFETLLRWNSPECGSVPPDIFIPMAEKHNLIQEIGDWVLNQSCMEFKRISDTYQIPLYVSVNFSAKQLLSQNIVRKIDQLLKKNKMSPQSLQLELTETSFLSSDTQVGQNLKTLEKLGIKIAIDDFGIGFASLVYLQKVSASIIKIDKSFIHQVDIDEQHQDLVKSIIVMGRSLNKDIVAEGVEKQEQLSFLKEHDCDKYQGYLFSKPVNVEEFEHMLIREKEGSFIFSDIKL
jgi:EAL domain-containing protein (putative c-di-GMP-specific phosphodiesterase class I)